MAMANLLLIPPPTISAPVLSIHRPMITAPNSKPIEEHILCHHSSRFNRSFSYTPSISSAKRPLSLLLCSKHAAAPITSVLKEHKGFGVNKNSSAFWAASFWDGLMRTDEKFMFPWAAKEDNTFAVAETEDEAKAAKREFHKTTRSSSGKPSRKIYTIIVGTSFCAVLVISCFVLPKQQALCRKVFPEHLSKSMEKFFYSFLYSHPWREHLSSKAMQDFIILAPGWINILLLYYHLNINQNIGQMRERKPSKKQSITFDDVEGVDAAKAELLEVVLCIKGDSKYSKLGAESPKGVLLAGPPGTGKTLLARAVAGEADVAFFSICASEFVKIHVGAGAARVRQLFRDARRHSPSIIFIDEIDCVGGERGHSYNSERDQTLNQILTEMDGFEKGENVVVMAATNRPELLDAALVRPGRFSRKVVVGKPNEDGRRKIFGLYLETVPMKEDKHVICDLVASRTPGLVGADLENIAKESRLLAGRRGGEFVTKEDVLQAIERATTKICNADK